MPLRSLDDAAGLLYQVSGQEELPPVIYLPGVHGDWTPLALARPLLSEGLRLVEAAYPRVEHWSLEDFGEALEALLDRLGLESAHLVGESFGSLVAWQFGLSRPERVRSLILVGGFSQPPSFRRAALARRALAHDAVSQMVVLWGSTLLLAIMAETMLKATPVAATTCSFRKAAGRTKASSGRSTSTRCSAASRSTRRTARPATA